MVLKPWYREPWAIALGIGVLGGLFYAAVSLRTRALRNRPEIAEKMQARAIFEAAVQAARATGQAVIPEVMIPLVMANRGTRYHPGRIVATAEAVEGKPAEHIEYQVGTMIELPRAALRADEIAEAREFFRFGTNDLTQTTLGISRDDAASFLGQYLEQGMLPSGPVCTSTATASANW